jgi:hypothetical protein
MNAPDLDRLQRAIDQRRRALDQHPTTSVVVEYRPHADGMLQLEKRLYVKKDGEVSERGRTGTSDITTTVDSARSISGRLTTHRAR